MKEQWELSDEKRLEEIISGMSLEEKLYCLTPLEGEYGRIRSIDFHGTIPQDVPAGGTDNWPSGQAVYGEDGKPNDGLYHPVAMPSNSTVAMSWDKQLVYRVGQIFALEARANPQRVDILNRPGMNLKRSPLCGRNYDYLSEDPVLTGILATEYVKGIQSEQVGACPKHFIANNQEFDRMNTDSVIDERTFQEIYLRPWKMVLQEAKPWMIMSSYNKVNGEWINSNVEIMEYLRKEIDYTGAIVSDFNAIHTNKVAAHKCSMDIELADPEVHIEELKQAIQTGAIEEKEIDGILRRVLKIALIAQKMEKTADLDMEKLHEEAAEIAAKCITLLKNQDILPLDCKKISRLLMTGELAFLPNVEGSGSGYMNGYRIDTPVKEIKKYAAEAGMETSYCQGYEMSRNIPPRNERADVELLEELENNLKMEDLVLAFVGAPLNYESEGYDRPSIKLPKNQEDMLECILQKTSNVILILTGGSVYDLAPYAERVKGILYAGFGGDGYGRAITDILFGKSEPGGRLTETFPMAEEHGPSWFDFAPEGIQMPHVRYSEGVLTGYRWYDTRKLPVLYPFGFGLSYTSFEYKNIAVDRTEVEAGESLCVCIDVKNIGKRKGSQVVQLYIHEKGGVIRRPEKELYDFEKVVLEPGETKTVRFHVKGDAFGVYSECLHKWIVQTDKYEILLNISAAETIGKAEIKVIHGDQAVWYDEMTPLVQYMKCPAFQEYLKCNCQNWMQDFFDSEKSNFLVLMFPLPIYRLTEPLQREPMFQEKQMKEIIKLCNQYQAQKDVL